MIGLSLAVWLAAAPASASAKQTETAAAMHAAMHAIVTLQPYLASPVAFRDPANASIIATSLAALSGVEHRFAAPAQEPTVKTLARVFGVEVARATSELAQGNHEATRARLKSITGMCFACHTRELAQKDFEDAAKLVDGLSLSPVQKAGFYATTRQFDRALAAWAVALAASPKTEADVFEQADAMRQSLAVLVRVKDDRAATVAALAPFLARKDLPGFLRRAYGHWQADALAWQADPFDARTAKPQALVEKSRALLQVAGAIDSVVADEDRYLVSLRAGGYLHRAIEREPNALWRSEALYLLAIASATSQEPLLWELDGLYLEACIREKPHSEIAVLCSDRMYDRAWVGWTGSGGTRIPPDIRKNLHDLRELAR
jgi:hypothetical protein